MTIREFYLNGNLCDISENTNVDLVFRSFLFSDISKIDGNRTWTINLPKTSRNYSIIEQIQQADSDSDFAYTQLTVDYYENNYHLIKGGNAIITNITNTINIVVTFSTLLDKIKEIDTKKLRELTEGAYDRLAWNRSISYNSIASGFGYCDWFNFTCEDRSFDLATMTNADIPSMVTHPTVTLKFLIDRIASEFSVNMNDLKNIAKMATTGVFLREKKGVSNFGTTPIYATATTDNVTLTNQFGDSFGRLRFASMTSAGMWDDFRNLYGMSIFYNFKKVRYNITELGAEFITDSNLPCYLKVVGFNGEYRNIATGAILNIGGGQFKHTFVGVDFVLDETDYFFSFYTDANSLPLYIDGELVGYDPLFTQFHSSLSFNYNNTTAIYSASTSGGLFPIIPNLPDMTCAKLIQDACILAGVFPFVNETDPAVIHFKSVKSIYDNKANAKDWSSKLVNRSGSMAQPTELSYKYSDYAQKNWLKYKEDDKNTLITSGALNCANLNLEKEKDIATLNFSAGIRNSDTVAVIDAPLYDIKLDGTTIITNPKTVDRDYLSKIENVDGINYLMFKDSLKFSEIVGEENYTYYQRIINKPRYAKELFNLKEIDVYGIDLSVPIYLNQHGKYYVILQITYNKNSFSEVELLELK